MFFSFASLKVRLLLSFLTFVLLSGGIGSTAFWYYQKKEEIGKVAARLDNLHLKILQAIQAQENFINYATTDTLFYQTGNSEYLTQHNRLINEFRTGLQALHKSGQSKDFFIRDNTNGLLIKLGFYEKTFDSLVLRLKNRGMQHEGLVGELNRQTQALAHFPRSAPANRDKLLILRRYGEEYAVHKSAGYLREFDNLYQQVRQELFIPGREPTRLDNQLITYCKSFRQLAKTDNVIGYDNSTGMRAHLRDYVVRIENQINVTVTKANLRTDELRKQFQRTFGLTLFLTVILSIVLGYIISYQIIQPIRSLMEQINRVPTSNPAKSVPAEETSNNEIGALKQGFNVMLEEIEKHLEEIREKTRALELQNDELLIVNKELAASEANLRKLNLVKDKFFFIISHDLKGPLATLSGFLQLLRIDVDSFSKKEISEVANNLNTSVQSLLSLLDNLLQWAISQTGELEVSPAATELPLVVSDNIQLLLESARLKKVRLTSAVSGNLCVWIDRNMLNFVLRNLISNAIKFTQPDGVVKITAVGKEEFVEIKVEDNGVGISKEGLSLLFHPEKRHSTLGTNKEKGTGFGLILCKDFVERNGGYISVESQFGVGTSITFTVPLAEVPQLADKAV